LCKVTVLMFLVDERGSKFEKLNPLVFISWPLL
jgi:hypothetical protein